MRSPQRAHEAGEHDQRARLRRRHTVGQSFHHLLNLTRRGWNQTPLDHPARSALRGDGGIRHRARVLDGDESRGIRARGVPRHTALGVRDLHTKHGVIIPIARAEIKINVPSERKRRQRR